jgi:hypothetical protein
MAAEWGARRLLRVRFGGRPEPEVLRLAGRLVLDQASVIEGAAALREEIEGLLTTGGLAHAPLGSCRRQAKDKGGRLGQAIQARAAWMVRTWCFYGPGDFDWGPEEALGCAWPKTQWAIAAWPEEVCVHIRAALEEWVIEPLPVVAAPGDQAPPAWVIHRTSEEVGQP